MALVVEPNQLSFQRPFTSPVKVILTLKNPSPETVAFKVKTTAPKQYCVRPNSGHVAGGQQAEIQVILQPMKEDPEPNARCRDKFMVQSVAVAPDELDLPMQQLWTSVDGERRRQISEQKLKCVYLPPGGARPNGNGPMNGNHDLAQARDEFGSRPFDDVRNPQRVSSYALAYSDDARKSQNFGPPASQATHGPPAQAMMTAARTDSPRDLESQVENLKIKLAHLDDALKHSRKEAAEAKTAQAQAELNLKQRIVYQKAVDSRAAEARVSSADGKNLSDQKYSAALVAIVSLISFLIGVLFF